MGTSHSTISTTTYVVIFVVLIALTALTASVAEVDLGRLNTPVALAIAATKAMLVVTYFMHLRHGSPLARVAAATAVIFLAILIGVTMEDVISRETGTYLKGLTPAQSIGPWMDVGDTPAGSPPR
jgi:cytochrome c oxidase subunit 4